jgi:serine phosphatase RsbU (regulator of sigma subunit)
MFPDLRVEPLRFALRAGDALVLYTDGLVERQGAVLDERTLVELVQSCGDSSMEELLDCLAKGVERLRPARDDVAAVALRPSRGSAQR